MSRGRVGKKKDKKGLAEKAAKKSHSDSLRVSPTAAIVRLLNFAGLVKK
jgi:hypothetical protein